MSPVICDTNIFVHYFIGHQATNSSLEKIGRSNVLIPSTVVMELIRGCGDKQAQTIMESRLKGYTLLHFNEQVSVKAVELLKSYRLSHDIKIPDALIAASALEFDLEIFTYNLKDFKYIPGIRLYQTA